MSNTQDALRMLTPQTIGGRNIVADECDRFADQLHRISDTILTASDFYRNDQVCVSTPVHLLQMSLQALSGAIMEAHAAWSPRNE